MQNIITLNDGKVIPQLGLGVWQVSDDQAQAAVVEAINGGYRHIDTASIYRNEEGVGRALKAVSTPRDDIFVTTKLWNADQANVEQALNDSLQRLQLDYVDLYLIHWPMPTKGKYIKAWEGLIKARDAGLVKSIGVSNFLPEHLQTLIDETGVTPVLNQIELHPLFNQRAVLQWCMAHNIYVQAWSPLAQGGKGVFDHENVLKVAQKHNKTVAQVVIRWHLQNHIITIPKSVTPSRIHENFNVFDFALDASDMALIDALDNNGRIGPNPAEYDYE